MSKTTEQVRKSLAKRYRAERRFKAFGVGAIGFGLLALVLLFTDIIGKGHSAFFETYVKMEVTFDQDTLDISDVRDEEQLNFANYDGVIRNALREEFPSASGRQEKRELYSLISTGAGYELRDLLKDDPSLMGRAIPACPIFPFLCFGFVQHSLCLKAPFLFLC